MPLSNSKSPKAFASNVKAEMAAGRPQKQALAIAYSAKRHARRMAKGGLVTPEPMDIESADLHEPNDYDNFLSAEDPSPIEHIDESDNQELSEHDNQVSDAADNEQGDPKEKRLESIMRNIRMRHMGR